MNETVHGAEPSRLLVFAHQAEAQAFADVPHLVTGIGKVRAAGELTRRLTRTDAAQVTEVVVLGTAGMISDALELDTVYRVRAAVQHDFFFDAPTALLSADGQVRLVGPAQGASDGHGGGEVVHDPHPNTAEPGQAPTAMIATGDVFVQDDALKASLVARGVELVDMESYAYAVACEALGVPLTIYKVPSDFADSETTGETWDDVVARKSHQLRQFARDQRLL